MFVSAGVDLKFHNFAVGFTEDLVYSPLGIGNVTSVSWSKDNSFLTFVSKNGIPEIISLKDPNNIKNVHTICAIADTSAVAFQKTTKRCIGLATNSGQVALYDTKNKVISKLFQSCKSAISFLDFNFDDKQMAVSCINGNILLYDVNRGEICESYTASEIYSPTSMRYHPAENHILTLGIEDGTVMQWDTNVGITRFCAQLHNAPVTGLAVLQNLDLIVSVGYDHKFCIHDLNRQCVFRSNQQHPLTAVDVSPDGVIIAVGSQAGQIYIYDSRRLMQPIFTWKAHNSKINKILFEYKLKYNITDTASDIHLATCQENLEPNMENENKHLKQEIGRNKPDDKFFYPMRNNAENEPMPMPDKRCQNETVSMKSIKHEVTDSIVRSTNEIRNHLMSQFASLHTFITNEFHTIDNQIDEKWDFLSDAREVTIAKEIKKNEVME